MSHPERPIRENFPETDYALAGFLIYTGIALVGASIQSNIITVGLAGNAMIALGVIHYRWAKERAV